MIEFKNTGNKMGTWEQVLENCDFNNVTLMRVEIEAGKGTRVIGSKQDILTY